MFEALSAKIFNSPQGTNQSINGISPEHWSYLASRHIKTNKDSRTHVYICPSIELLERLEQNLKKVSSNINCIRFIGLDNSPYSGFVASEKNLFDQFKSLNKLIFKEDKKINIILATKESLSLLVPAREFFDENSLKIQISDIIPPLELAAKLTAIGYKSSTTVEEPGTFSQKGEVFDIYAIEGKAFRLHYFDDMVEEILGIDLETNRTIKDSEHKEEEITLCPTPQIVAFSPYTTYLRENIPRFGPNQKFKFEERKRIFNLLSDELLFENYASYFSQFFKEKSSLYDYLPKDSVFHFIGSEEIQRGDIEYKEELRVGHEDVNGDEHSECLLPPYENLYDLSIDNKIKKHLVIHTNQLSVANAFEENLAENIDLLLETTKSYFDTKVNPTLKKHEYIKAIFEYIKKEFAYSGNIIITTQTQNSKNEIKHLIEVLGFNSELTSRVTFEDHNLSTGFFYSKEKTLVLSDSDLFSHKIAKTKKQKRVNLDVFAEQLSTLKVGDFVVHSDHGVGKYLGLQTLDIGSSETDYIIIEYKGSDKVYLPVYKMNLIQKHADAMQELSIDSLRTNKFALAKTKARTSAKALAFDLLKLQAERESSSAFSFSAPDEEYKEFELAFPFQETPDQSQAIEAVIEDMMKTKAMDRLVCGDVGFGKTEVAMRAAFKAVLDNKQVAILVPTTVLATQHYNSFKKRFKKFPVNIEFISRFRTAKEVKQILEDLEHGTVDIIIGTHKLLSDKIKYNDLGLVVVDEEQRFGVAHKEKLKLLKANVDFLTLTATPIPRTLQLSFLGIRDLSLIQTAPPRRQSIKSYLIKQDDRTIQEAIKKELGRGGQVFIVHNKVSDIEQYTAYIQELVPEAKIVFAHGQLPERELENRMAAFYRGDFQILIATTIIESGIDIPNANTMIIDKANMYGLSQLHQLRGRIGRSDKKAYAYFVIPQNKILSEIAQKRLKALQTYADMGSGFNIASCDLEIRGAGDILGGSQAGHLDSIGLELYMELLKEAILEIRGEKKIINRNIEFNTPFPSYIPNHYIDDASERLKTYKRLSNINEIETLEDSREGLLDIYGLFPQEIRNLFTILECRIRLEHTGVKTIGVAGKAITIQFEKSLVETNEVLRNQIVEFFIGKPKKYKFTQDFKVIYQSKSLVDIEQLITFCKEIGEGIMKSI